MWRLVPWDSWHPVLQRGVRQPSLLQSTANGNGKHLARPILEIRHEHRLVWGELEHARARPIAYEHTAAPFVRLFPSHLCVPRSHLFSLHFPSG